MCPGASFKCALKQALMPMATVHRLYSCFQKAFLNNSIDPPLGLQARQREKEEEARARERIKVKVGGLARGVTVQTSYTVQVYE